MCQPRLKPGGNCQPAEVQNGEKRTEKEVKTMIKPHRFYTFNAVLGRGFIIVALLRC